MTTTALAGSTGLVGSHILSTLLATPSVTAVHAYARRDLPKSESDVGSKLHPLTSTDTSTWSRMYPKEPPTPTVFFSGLGTTKAAAGSTEKQYAIDHDLNLDLARAAKEAGTKVYVLISSSGANATSMIFYSKMKGELEENIKKLEFDHFVILRPGLIVGDRQESRAAEGVLRGVANMIGKVAGGLKDVWAQDADVIAKAAVRAGLDCVEGKHEKGVWMIGQSDIVKLGRTEWKK